MALRQESITKWIDGADLAKPYFYLDWDINKMFPENQATWYHKVPIGKKIKWKKVIKVGYREVTLCSSYLPYHTDVIEGSMYDSFLQSHLQKAVRRKKKRASVFTADLLLELNPLKLLRRLPIVMIEDSFGHQSFPTVIWLMCLLSIKGNNLFENQKRWILGVVYLITCFQYKEHVGHETDDFVFSSNLSKIHNIKHKDTQDIIYSVETRRCYGGMKNDDNMFQSYEKQYLERFSGKNVPEIWSTLFYEKIRPIYTKKTKFEQQEWLLEGYDFHTNPMLLKLLEEEFNEFDEDEHKRAIWYKSSGINYRKTLNYNLKNEKYDLVATEYIPDNITIHWNIIRRTVRRKAWGFVQGMLENLNLMYPDWIDYIPWTPQVLEESQILRVPDTSNTDGVFKNDSSLRNHFPEENKESNYDEDQ